MTEDQFRQEMLYQATLAIARAMLHSELITSAEFGKLDKVMKLKYTPVLGSLKTCNP